MGVVKIKVYNTTLMNIANYEDTAQLKNLLKNYESLGNLRFRGDTVAHSIWLDLTEAIESNAMTITQKRCVIGYFIEKMTFQELAELYDRDKSTIRHNVNGGVKRIQKMLLGGNTNDKSNVGTSG